MDWQIKPFSRRCIVTETAFEAGDAYVSYLVIDGAKELQRYDVAEAKDAEFQVEGEVLCRWRQVYKEPPEKDDSARRQRETAEGLFLSLYEEIEEAGEESEIESEDRPDEEEARILKKFLGLLLERKRILRPRGQSPDGSFRLMEHAKTKNIYPVPAGELAQEELLRISERLNSLVS